MSDTVLDRGSYFPSPMTDWYRERPFKVAFAVSVLIHAGLITFIPGFRSVTIDTPRVLEVQIVPEEVAPMPRIQEKPVVLPRIAEPKFEPVPEPIVRQPESKPEPVAQKPQPEPKREPVLRRVQPEPPPVPRTDVIQTPRAEPKPDFVMPKPELRPEPNADPRVEIRPEPRIEPQPQPAPLARVEPRPEPRPKPIVEPRPESRIEPKAEVTPEVVNPIPREVPPPVVQPRVEPSVTPPTAVRPAPAPVATAPAPPVVAPQPTSPKIDEANEDRLKLTYGQSISKEIKRYQKYPPPAQRRGWEGTTEVLLQIAADGRVTGITLGKSSGHAILDDEALDMVRRASPLPQAPPELRGRALVVTVPIVFRLQNS